MTAPCLPVPDAETLLASRVKGPAGASSSCPLQVTLPESHWFWWEEGWAPSLPENNCTRAPGLQLYQEAGRLCLPFPAAPALPGENQVSPVGRETELAARGQRLFSCKE